MHFDMPIEQIRRRTDTRFQAGFAHEARERLPDNAEFMLQASKRGLLVWGRNEEALAAPVEALRDVYGPNLEVQPAPSVACCVTTRRWSGYSACLTS